jgi:ABC-type sugar transport system substrate-binding protein
MKLSRILGVGVAAGLLVVAMTACTTPASGTTDSTGPKNGKTYVFGNIAYDMKDTWNAYSVKAFDYAAKKVGVDTVDLDAGNSLDQSVSLMQQLINKNVDAINVFPISPEQAATLGKMADAAGIPVTFENTTPTLDKSKYISVVAAEYGTIGAAAMDYIAKNYPGAKVLFVAGAQGGGVYESYQKGIDAELTKLKGKISIVSTVHGDWETEKALNVTSDAIQAGTKFDVVFANNELMAQGVRNALDEAGLKTPIVSTGGGPDGLAMIKSGSLTATMSAPVSLQGLITFKNLYQSVVEKKTPKKFISLPVIPVDKSTIDKAISWEVSDAAVKYIGGIK